MVVLQIYPYLKKISKKIWTEEGIKAGATEAAQIYAATKTGGLVTGGFKKTIAQIRNFIEGIN